MLKNYFKIALRSIQQNKVFASINILGLVVGIACCILIGLYISHELSYDEHFENAENIYRVEWWSQNPQTRTPHPMAQAMVRDLPEVKHATTLSPIWGPGLTRPTISVRYKDTRFDEEGFYSADSTFFDVFSFKLLRGKKDEALTQPGGIVITQEMAQKYFGNSDPMGKTLRINDSYELEVTGVMENIPGNTHFHFDFLISYVTLKITETGNYYTWEDFGHFNYVVLDKSSKAGSIEAKIPDWSAQYIDWNEDTFASLKDGSIGFQLMPITDIHLYSDIRWELEANGNIAYIYIFLGAALFILIIACVNFMNLTTARSLTRAKEVGLRKTVGAERSQLIMQFLAEAVIICMISGFLALAAVDLLLPWFTEFSGISVNFGLSRWQLFVTILAGVGLLGILSGSYPALVLSKFNPARVLKGKFSSSNEGLLLRKVLVVVQFAVSVILIVGTLVIYKQLNFVQEKDLGFEQEQVAVLPMRSNEIRDRFEALKDQVLNVPGVMEVSAASNIPGGNFNQNPVRWRAEDPSVDVLQMGADYDVLQTLDINLVSGRAFSKEYGEDAGGTFILNETAASQFEWDNAIGKELTFYDDEEPFKATVVGVVEDFHFQSLHQNISPLIIRVVPDEFNYMLVKLEPQNINEQLASIENIWQNFEPVFGFEYSFLDNAFEANYRQEQKAGSILFLFSALAILIACMGLWGLTSFSVQSRLKEIGIRKVLGADTFEIVGLFSKQFIWLVLISLVISLPVATWIMNSWLQNFAYQTGVGIFVLATGSLIAIAISLLTTATIASKAAKRNPIESLQSE